MKEPGGGGCFVGEATRADLNGRPKLSLVGKICLWKSDDTSLSYVEYRSRV